MRQTIWLHEARAAGLKKPRQTEDSRSWDYYGKEPVSRAVLPNRAAAATFGYIIVN